MHHAGAAGFLQEAPAKPDQSARGDVVFEAHAAARMRYHRAHLAFARRQQLRDDADVVLGNIDDEKFHRLEDSAVLLFGDYGRLRDLQLVTLPPHRFDDHRELQLAAAHHPPLIGADRFNLDADVAARFVNDALAELARGHEL